VVTVEANSDDLDNIVKKFFKEHPDLIERCRIGTMNSLNWCRVMLQTAHHFYAYFQVNIFFRCKLPIIGVTGAQRS